MPTRQNIARPPQQKQTRRMQKAPPQNHIRSGQLELYLLMLPVLVHILIFCYIPMYGIVIAFQEYHPGSPFLSFSGDVQWVGFKHFHEFISNIYFWRLIRNTLVLSFLNIGFGFWIPIIFALLLNEIHHKHYKKFIQTASYLPYFISSVVVAGMVLSFVNVNGIFNVFRQAAGLNPVAYDVEPKYFPIVYTITNIWKGFGWNSILYLSAMSSIDPALYESARLDGAGRGRQMWSITLPMIRPTILLMLIMAFGGILNANTEMILLMYNPSNYSTSDVIGTYVYRDSLLGGKFSFGTAVGLFTAVIGFAMVYIANSVARKTCDYSLW